MMPRIRFHFGTLLILLCSVSARAADFTGEVVSIADGDTITILVGESPMRIRLHGIDCPEKKQSFGTRAKQFAGELAFGKTVVAKVRYKDRYGRFIAEVILPDGRSMNRELLRAGFAWWYRKYAPADAELERIELDAQAAKLGLWSDVAPLPPWEYRRMSVEERAAIANR